MTDTFYMKRALKLARKGQGRVSPNPMVGAVIVKDGKIIGEGYHKEFGGNHAEINAIESASYDIRGSTFYVTLEPCCHYGKTPPCTDSIIKVKPSRIAVGILDPNPLVSGRSIDILKHHGIETDVGILEEECGQLNEIFFKFVRTKTPFITLKFAQTIDGKIATSAGHSKWISSEPSLMFAHRLRSNHDGIMVGAGTIITDDPELTVRHVRGRNPLRIVVDSTLRIQANARVLKNQENAKTIIATTQHCNKENLRYLTDSGVETLIINSNDHKHVDLKKLLVELGKREISSVLVEGGSEIITSFLKDKIADRIVIITAPKIIGRGTPAIGDLGIKRMNDAIKLSSRKVFKKGDDIIIDVRL